MATSKITKDKENVYSTQETIVGTWLGSEPIYRRVFENYSFGGIQNAWTDTGITMTNVKNLISVKVTGRNAPLLPPFGYKIDNNKLQYYSINSSWNNTYNVIVEYTKTTN